MTTLLAFTYALGLTAMRGASYFFPWYPGISVIFSILMVSWYLDGIQYFDGIPVFQWYSVF